MSIEVYVQKDTFKFTAAHFVAFRGYRERLHGHNYHLGVRMLGDGQPRGQKAEGRWGREEGGGSERGQPVVPQPGVVVPGEVLPPSPSPRYPLLGADGYVIDFGCIKSVCNTVCKRLHEHFLCPTYSDVLSIQVVKNDDNNSTNNEAASESVRIVCEDGSVFVFPKQDCAMLPIVHASAEELAIYLWSELLKGLDADVLMQRGIHTMEVTVAEAVGQEATFRWPISNSAGPNAALDVRQFVQVGEVVPMPCPTESNGKQQQQHQDVSTSCCPNCQRGTADWSTQLERIAQAINNGSLDNGKQVSTNDLEAIIKAKNMN